MKQRDIVILVLCVMAGYLMLQVLNHGFNLNLIEGLTCKPKYTNPTEAESVLQSLSTPLQELFKRIIKAQGFLDLHNKRCKEQTTPKDCEEVLFPIPIKPEEARVCHDTDKKDPPHIDTVLKQMETDFMGCPTKVKQAYITEMSKKDPGGHKNHDRALEKSCVDAYCDPTFGGFKDNQSMMKQCQRKCQDGCKAVTNTSVQQAELKICTKSQCDACWNSKSHRNKCVTRPFTPSGDAPAYTPLSCRGDQGTWCGSQKKPAANVPGPSDQKAAKDRFWKKNCPTIVTEGQKRMKADRDVTASAAVEDRCNYYSDQPKGPKNPMHDRETECIKHCTPCIKNGKLDANVPNCGKTTL